MYKYLTLQRVWNDAQLGGQQACLVCKRLVFWLDLVPLQSRLCCVLVQAVCIRPLEGCLQCTIPVGLIGTAATTACPVYAHDWYVVMINIQVHICIYIWKLRNRIAEYHFYIGFCTVLYSAYILYIAPVLGSSHRVKDKTSCFWLYNCSDFALIIQNPLAWKSWLAGNATCLS